MQSLRDAWDTLLAEAKLIAGEINVTPQLSKESSRQKKRRRFHDETAEEETTQESSETVFRNTVFYTAMDSIISDLDTRFRGIAHIVNEFSAVLKAIRSYLECVTRAILHHLTDQEPPCKAGPGMSSTPHPPPPWSLRTPYYFTGVLGGEYQGEGGEERQREAAGTVVAEPSCHHSRTSTFNRVLCPEGRTVWRWGGGYHQQQTLLGPHPEAWVQEELRGCGSPPPPASPPFPPPVDAAAVSIPAEALRWDAVVQGSSLSTGGRLPDSRKPGPDGALGHAATPPWARAPALGFQRDVTGGLALPLHCRIPAPPAASPKPPPQAFSPHSLPAPKCPSNSFSVSTMNPGSLSHCAIPTTAASHFGGEGGGCAATLHPSAPCLSMLWTMMLQHGSLGAVKTLASFSLYRSPHGISLAGPPVKFLPSWSRHSRSQPPCLGRAEWLGPGKDGAPPEPVPNYKATTPGHSTFLQLLTSPPSNQERGEGPADRRAITDSPQARGWERYKHPPLSPKCDGDVQLSLGSLHWQNPRAQREILKT
ncbi:unnamed protein product [Pleuronectes platessa]|uniref:Uncharacterized protein n=1 Tax=Pleuronectes platessa TaxID=8262 RepID=A0A9N7VBN5_PLEPL|nr:unnamed protein product [Pleuronectes platessa]